MIFNHMIVYGLLALFLLWLLVLSYIIYTLRSRYLNITSSTRSYKIDEILDKLITGHQVLSGEIAKVNKEIKSIEGDLQTRFQKVGLIRFNPFGRSVVDQSFVLSLLNNENNGIVINFIYTHDGVRVYAKKVKNGQGEGHQLSEEEKEAIEKSKSL